MVSVIICTQLQIYDELSEFRCDLNCSHFKVGLPKIDNALVEGNLSPSDLLKMKESDSERISSQTNYMFGTSFNFVTVLNGTQYHFMIALHVSC